MPTDPDNNRYPVDKEYGADNYDDPINQNFNELATDVPEAGPIADRPNPGVWAPDRWYATDKYQEYYNTGSSWRKIGVPFRTFSSFMGSTTPVQDAADWTNAKGSGAWNLDNAGAVFIDGIFETDEPTVTLEKRSKFFGMGFQFSQLRFSRSTSAPMFEYGGAGLQHHTWHNIQLRDVQTGTRDRGALKPIAGSSGSFGAGTVFNNVYLIDVGGVYPFELNNAYWSTINNLFINTKDSAPTGHFKFKDCNACHFSGVRSMWNTAQDSETPCTYIVDCKATLFDSPHIEHLITDAAMQISGGNVTINTIHIEGNQNPNQDFPKDYHCGIQIGDGGITTGNTEGATSPTNVVIQGGICHGSANDLEGIRLLNGDEVTITNFHTFQGVTHRLLNYGGSNNDSAAALTTAPRKLIIIGNDNAAEDISVASGLSNPDILLLNGANHASDTDAQNAMKQFEIAFITPSTGATSLARKNGDGSISVWDADRSL